MARRVRLPVAGIRAGRLVLDPAAGRYLTRVHRLGTGARFLAFDPELAVEADAEISALGPGTVSALVGPLRPASLRPGRPVVVVQAAGKGDKLDDVLRDATELGATRFAPAIAERSVRRPTRELAVRLRRVALEAARQCGRGDAPAVDEPLPLPAVLAGLEAATTGFVRLCLHPAAERRLADCAPDLVTAAGVVLLFGPEGGFSPGELELSRAHGFTGVSLGPLVLRTETACAATLGGLLSLGIASIA